MYKIIVGCLLLASYAPLSPADDLSSWLAQENQIAIQKLEQNLLANGAVLASPQQDAPNYYYHWTRDASLTADTLVGLFEKASGALRDHYYAEIINFAEFSQMTQLNGSPGEPKFYVDGRPFDGSWCRPQSDGPALRAMALTRFATDLLNDGGNPVISSFLYNAQKPSVIKTDLEYVSNHWQEPTCDLWEEVNGDHFFTRLVQFRALLNGADLADRRGDPGAATWYRLQAKNIRLSLGAFWHGTIIVPTLHQSGGLKSKISGIDSSVILAALHAYKENERKYYVLSSYEFFTTFHQQVDIFQKLYPINATGPGVAIGRYPEDVYDGDKFAGGNPWVLLTAAFARFSYLAAIEIAKYNPDYAKVVISEGDSFLQRIRTHAYPDGSLSEQINRDTGYMTSARDLTWNYVELIEAIDARNKALRLTKRRSGASL